jgi:hypothetical protein
MVKPIASQNNSVGTIDIMGSRTRRSTQTA